ncbi:alpha/beta hydrolase [Candidatus Saccharibacteria bacterium]|nr:alpha/beta hydrolase [Candidatus Saccharibacteria bacterium]
MKSQKLYIIHGWTYTTKYWDETLKILEKRGVEVEMLKVPGLTKKDDHVFKISDYVRWADQNIPDGSVALGHSNGGRILLNLCAENPQKLEKLILLNSAGVYEKSTKRDIFRTVSKLFAPLKKLPLLRKIVHKLLGASDYDHAPENMKKTLAGLLDSDKSLTLEKVTTETTLLWGEKDTTTPPHQGRALHEKLKNSTLTFYKDWDHAPYIKHPDELADAIISALPSDFLKNKKGND